MKFVPDASIALAWLFEDESHSGADRLLDSLPASTLVVPALWFLELCNVIAGAERRGRLTARQATRILGFVRQWPVETDSAPAERTFDTVVAIAREHALTAYDAAYLELALRRTLPLATLDQPLRRAAAAAGVSVLP